MLIPQLSAKCTALRRQRLLKQFVYIFLGRREIRDGEILAEFATILAHVNQSAQALALRRIRLHKKNAGYMFAATVDKTQIHTLEVAMLAKLSGKAVLLPIAGLLLVFGLFPGSLAAQGVIYLQAGSTTPVQIDANQATCVSKKDYGNDNGGTALIRTGCEDDNAGYNNEIFMYLDTGAAAVEADLTAESRLVVQFQVNTAPGGPASVLPVLISVPVTWKGLLFNDAVKAYAGGHEGGGLKSVGAGVDVNGSLKLTEGTAGDPQLQGKKVSVNHFMGAFHAGVAGCLSVPTTPVSALSMAGKCAVAIYKKEEGAGKIYLSGLIQTGQTYDVELQLGGDDFSTLILGAFGHPLLDFGGADLPGQHLGLVWSGPMKISVGTDYQEQINQLRASLATLRFEFLHHTHAYLTGKGVGQNNTNATTGPPVFPVAEH